MKYIVITLFSFFAYGANALVVTQNGALPADYQGQLYNNGAAQVQVLNELPPQYSTGQQLCGPTVTRALTPAAYQEGVQQGRHIDPSSRGLIRRPGE